MRRIIGSSVVELLVVRIATCLKEENTQTSFCMRAAMRQTVAAIRHFSTGFLQLSAQQYFGALKSHRAFIIKPNAFVQISACDSVKNHKTFAGASKQTACEGRITCRLAL
ncbi:hypothetical protein [Stenotrophomonas humi]|uniref:hypothetical protein n=1 Tax=Stenotrophomonas humi TaxID=405444 RepID=UPI00128F9D9A|nr:hypothetical protein [Stenotrophomonas humi]